MKQKTRFSRICVCWSSGMAMGAALGLLCSMMLLEDAVAGPVIGAVLGGIGGLIWDVRSQGERGL